MKKQAMTKVERREYMREYMRNYRKLKKQMPNVSFRDEAKKQHARGNKNYRTFDLLERESDENGDILWRSPAQAIYEHTKNMTDAQAKKYTDKFWKNYRKITDNMSWLDIDSQQAFNTADAMVNDDTYQWERPLKDGEEDVRTILHSLGYKIVD